MTYRHEGMVFLIVCICKRLLHICMYVTTCVCSYVYSLLCIAINYTKFLQSVGGDGGLSEFTVKTYVALGTNASSKWSL